MDETPPLGGRLSSSVGVALCLGLALALVLLVALLALLLRGRTAPPPEPPSPPEPPRAVPDVARPAEVAALIAPRLAGTSLDGADLPEGTRAVVWCDLGDEVVAHLDSVTVAVEGDTLLVAIDLESDETGRATIVVPFAVGGDPAGGVVLATEARPRGPAPLVARWGDAVVEAAWAAVTDLVRAHADERGSLPAALYSRDGALRFEARK